MAQCCATDGRAALATRLDSAGRLRSVALGLLPAQLEHLPQLLRTGTPVLLLPRRSTAPRPRGMMRSLSSHSKPAANKPPIHGSQMQAVRGGGARTRAKMGG
jgi:hypothetical protein